MFISPLIRRFALLALFPCLVGVGSAYAQSTMTDTQVMEFILKEQQRGRKTGEIVPKLIERGVNVQQIQRVRRRMQQEQNNAVFGQRDQQAVDAQKRTRKPNTDLNQRSNLDEYDQQRSQEIIRREVNALMPDSLADERLDFEVTQSGKQIFGHNIFNNKKLTFEPEMNIPTPSSYLLGAGDQVFVDIYGASQRTIEATVSAEGNINISGFGPVQVSGLTVAQAERRLRSTLGQRYQNSALRVSVGQTRPITVNVMGDVRAPGTYTLSAFSTVFHALYMAGGITDIGSLRNVQVYRGGRVVSTVDVYDYILSGRLTGNVRLQSGDVVQVPAYESLVKIDGRVKRPMWYEMKSSESVATLLSYAGGFAGGAYESSVNLVRQKGGEFSIFSLDAYERSSFRVADGDSVYVDSALNRFTNMVEIRGEVRRPGAYQMDGSVGTVRQLIEHVGGLTEYAFKARGLMHRRREDHTLEAQSFDVEALLDHRAPDIPLRNEDVVYIPSVRDLQEERTLMINGEVNSPGVYGFVENTTVEDLILQAGGLRDAASLVKVDVSRRIRNASATSSSQQVAQNFSFAIKDGFVIDGTPGFVLQPFDEVVVRRSPGYVNQEHVLIEGEVHFGGSYVISSKAERLSDLIRAAGGITEEAYVEGARLERQMTYQEKLRQQNLLRLVVNDSVDLKKLEISDRRSIGISLDKALENPGSEWDVVVRDGDRIFIPQYTNTVSINGEVMYPNTVTYKEGATLSYYLNQAGGFSTKAKKGRVFAVNMNGTVTRVRSAQDIKPGCEIVVPSKAVRHGLSFAEALSLGTMGVSVAAVLASILK